MSFLDKNSMRVSVCWHGSNQRTFCIAATDPKSDPCAKLLPNRWIEAEREEALLGKGGAAESRKDTVAHEAEAFMALGHGPRLCPGQVRLTKMAVRTKLAS